MTDMSLLANLTLQQRFCMETLISQFNFEQDSNRLAFVNLHEPWVLGGSWGTGEYLRYGKNTAGKSGLYMTSRNVSNATTPPDTTPGSYTFIGWCTT